MRVFEEVSKTGFRRVVVAVSPPAIVVSCRASATVCPPLTGASTTATP